jgi:hypothetical protein
METQYLLLQNILSRFIIHLIHEHKCPLEPHNGVRGSALGVLENEFGDVMELEGQVFPL